MQLNLSENKINKALKLNFLENKTLINEDNNETSLFMTKRQTLFHIQCYILA
jgi:hypothetical protein